jgi:putative oxidoreductase
MYSSPVAPSRRIDQALLVLRIAAGTVFFVHGYMKLFTMGIAGTTGFFTQVGAPLPAITAPLIGVLETFGGIALILGLLTPFVALGLALDMLGAIMLVHRKGGFMVPNGIEFVMTLCAISIALAIAGAGSYSVDAVIASRKAGRT